jgi:drug/metabolite transporter (DMT)-like permease
MGYELGILLAFAALICWGVGDFLVQRSSRRFGDWETLFFISLFATLAIFPFIYSDLPGLFSNENYWILIIVSVIMFIASMLDFEALKQGKLAIMDPVFALEVPVTALLAYFVLGESLSLAEIILISSIVVGLVMVSIKTTNFKAKHLMEKGVFLAITTAFFMGLGNFFVGFSSRLTNPLLTMWVLHAFALIISFFYLLSQKKLGKAFLDVEEHEGLVVSLAIIDNGAWVFYAFAASLAPIAIVVAISESYIGLAVILGLVFNNEKLHPWQEVGLVLAMVSAISLAAVAG